MNFKGVKVMQICEQKLDKHNIPKKYLDNKEFSYKLYLNLCNIAFWRYDKDDKDNNFIEYRLFGYNITQMATMFKMSKDTIRKKLKSLPYRDKFDTYETDEDNTLLPQYTYTRTKHLMFNSPRSNYTTISNNILDKLINLDEMSIRFYILLNGMKNKTIKNTNQEGILNYIGYNGKSNNNKNKLTKVVKNLSELKLITYDSYYEEGLKRLVYKIN